MHGKLPPGLVGPAAPVRHPARESAVRERRGVEALDLALARALPVRGTSVVGHCLALEQHDLEAAQPVGQLVA